MYILCTTNQTCMGSYFFTVQKTSPHHAKCTETGHFGRKVLSQTTALTVHKRQSCSGDGNNLISWVKPAANGQSSLAYRQTLMT